MNYKRQAAQALFITNVPAPRRYGDTILHSIAHKKETNQMKWALEFYGKELIYEQNNFDDTVLHQLLQKEGDTKKTVKIIEMVKQFLGKRFKDYVVMPNRNGLTAYDLARRFQSSQEIIEALENDNITHTLRVTYDSKQQEVVRPPPSDSHNDTVLAISFYKRNLSLCEWWIKYFGNDKNEVTNTNTNAENAFHQLFREDGRYAVENLTRRKMINILRTHILSKWGVGTYIDMIGQENKFGLSVLSSAIKNGGDVEVVKEFLAGISLGDQKIIIEKENTVDERSPLDFASGRISKFLRDIVESANREVDYSEQRIILSKENELEKVEVDLETDDEDPVATDESLPEVENIIKNVIEPDHQIRDEEMVKLLKQEKKQMVKLLKQEKKRKLHEIRDLDQRVAYLEQTLSTQKRNKHNY